mmetsp:Transcript_10074/g.24818  ORF Transcript_10074/g.24818 Transcript_10074/m.24818 type:complete len:376 (+) Transcript_10074:242-1369(+)
MSTVNFAEKAIERSQAAVALDREALKVTDPMEQKEKFEEALNSYIQAIEAFKPAIKWEKIASRKEQFTAKMIEYVGRAEAIKKILNEPVVPVKQKAAAGGGGDDKDKTKMSDAMQGAIVKEKPNVKWDDIAGLEQAKEALKEAVILPIKFPQLFSSSGRTPWSGIMLYGPPGTGKSYLAKAVATEADATFLSVSSSDLTSKWLGESEKLVKMMFETARENRPSIVFIDEIDAIATRRFDAQTGADREVQRILMELLNQMDGFEENKNVRVIMATNRIDTLDPALLRPGRIDRKIGFPLPNRREKRFIFQTLASKMNIGPDVDLEEFIRKPHKLSGAVISAICQEAGLQAIRRNRFIIIQRDFEIAYELNVILNDI